MKQKINLIFTMILVFALLITMVPIFIAQSQVLAAVNDPTFSIMQISDTQFLSLSFPQLFKDTTNWIVSNAAINNLKMVIHTGDLVDNINGTSGTYSDPVQWDNANAAMNQLLNADIPYCWDAGNHDQIPWNDANGTWLGSSYSAFNASNMRSKPYWVSDLVDSKNTAVRFTYKGYDFLVINIEYMASNTTITWMKNLLENNKGTNVIIAAHTYLNKGGTYGFSSAGLPGEVSWCTNFKTILDGYPNIFLTLSGHDPTGTANMSRVGNREEIFFNRQSATTAAGSTGAAAVRIYTFDLTNMQVNTKTYSLDTQTWLTTASNQFSFNVALNRNDWVLVNDARTVKGSPDLREYVWQKNASMAPNGPYDKIALHRLVKPGIITKGAVFVDPGIYGSGEQLISNPSTSSYSIDESSNQLVYWANRGFDVYSIDWRSHFIPLNMNTSQASAMATNWGWDQYISDMKEAVDKTKELSGNTKIFLAGMSWGGAVAMSYASEYWKQDLRGIILLDGGENTIQSASITNSYNVTTYVNLLAPAGGMMWENPRRSQTSVPTSGMIFAYQNALQNPGAPAEWPIGTPLQPTTNPLTNKTWTNITEYIAYQQYSTNFSNIYEGYGNITVIIQRLAGGDRYWPLRLGIESNAIHDWRNCPFVKYDFDDHYKEIDVPMLGFRSELYGIPTYGNYAKGMATADFTQINLPKYGHLDVYVGPYSARDVSEPTYQWMINHLLHVVSVTKSSDMVTPGFQVNFNVTASGGTPPYSYQWYIETSQAIATIGTNSSRLDYSSYTPNSYNFYCRITDTEGTTTNSTKANLIVFIVPAPTPTLTSTLTPTSAPTQTTTPTIAPTPTPSPTPSPTPTSTPTPTPSITTSASNLTNTATYVVVTIIAILVIAATATILFSQKRAKKIEDTAKNT